MKSWWLRFPPLQGYAQCKRLKGLQQDATHIALTVCPEQLQYKLQLPQGPSNQHPGVQLRGTGGCPCLPHGLHPKEGMLAQIGQLSPVPAAFLTPLHPPIQKLRSRDTGIDNDTASLLSQMHRRRVWDVVWAALEPHILMLGWVTVFHR